LTSTNLKLSFIYGVMSSAVRRGAGAGVLAYFAMSSCEKCSYRIDHLNMKWIQLIQVVFLSSLKKLTPTTLKIIWWILSPLCTHLYHFSLHFFLNNIVMALNVSLENYIIQQILHNSLWSQDSEKMPNKYCVEKTVCRFLGTKSCNATFNLEIRFKITPQGVKLTHWN
jgi:hypothetical protein